MRKAGPARCGLTSHVRAVRSHGRETLVGVVVGDVTHRNRSVMPRPPYLRHLASHALLILLCGRCCCGVGGSAVSVPARAQQAVVPRPRRVAALGPAVALAAAPRARHLQHSGGVVGALNNARPVRTLHLVPLRPLPCSTPPFGECHNAAAWGVARPTQASRTGGSAAVHSPWVAGGSARRRAAGAGAPPPGRPAAWAGARTPPAEGLWRRAMHHGSSGQGRQGEDVASVAWCGPAALNAGCMGVCVCVRVVAASVGSGNPCGRHLQSRGTAAASSCAPPP